METMYPGGNYGQWQYQGQPQQTMDKVASTLTPEEHNRLAKKISQFSIAITDEERLRGICNHRTEDGSRDTLVRDPVTGSFRCTVCGYTFNVVDSGMSADDLKTAVREICDILQTIKLLYTDLPIDAAREYFQIIPLVEKIPQLFEFAVKNFEKHEAYNWSYNYQNSNVYTLYNRLSNMFGTPGVAPMYGNPQAGYGQPPFQQPPMGGFGQPAPMPNPAFQQQMPFGGPSNGFGYPGAGTQQGYMPQTQGFNYTPQDQTTPAQPTVDAAVTAEAPVDTVSQQVKA